MRDRQEKKEAFRGSGCWGKNPTPKGEKEKSSGKETRKTVGAKRMKKGFGGVTGGVKIQKEKDVEKVASSEYE